MKNLFIFLSLIFFFTPSVYAIDSTMSAAEATPTAVVAKTTPVEKKAQDLLDRVATKVAQIATATKRTYHGKIKSVGTTSYTIVTPEGDRTIVTNDATDFYRIKASKRSTTDFAGIKKDEDIVAIGTIDPSNKSMTASQVIAKIKRTVIAGPIENVTGTVVTIDGNKVDIADASYQAMDSEGKITVAKIGDFKEGQTAFLLAHSPEGGTYSSLKALVISN